MGKSLRKAINDKCKECIYDPGVKGNGTWRQQVEACTGFSCPLWPVRPLAKKGANTDDDGNNDAQESGDLEAY